MKKVLAVSLAVIMLLASIASTTVFAVQTNHTQTNALEWDTNSTETGSLTIYQYQLDAEHWSMRGTTQSGLTGQTGNGMPNAVIPGASSNVCTPLAGVEYTIYQMVAYTGAGAVAPDANDITPAQAATNVTNHNYLASYSGVTQQYSSGSNTYCSVKFENLPLGCYYVVETAHPQNVDVITDPFLIDIPMVNPNGNEWNYDVNVYPKNQTVYGGVTLTKRDSRTNANLQGASFKLQYRTIVHNDTTGLDEEVWNDYMVDTDSTTDSEGTMVPVTVQVPLERTTNSSGQLSISNLPGNATYRFIETGAPTGYIFDPSKTSSSFTIDASHKSNAVTVYNNKPTIDKKVTSLDVGTTTTGSGYTKHTTANIGDSVYFLITVDVPEEIARMSTFAIVDTLDSGLSFTGTSPDPAQNIIFDDVKTVFFDSVGDKVNINEGAFSSVELNYQNDPQKVRFNFNCAALDNTNRVTKIQLVYKAFLNTDAYIGSTASMSSPASNYNSCKLIYSVNATPTLNDDVAEINATNPPEVHTGGYMFTKTNAQNQPLPGAKFKVYSSYSAALAGTAGTELTVYVYDSDSDLVPTTELVAGADGTVKFVGLAYGGVADHPYRNQADGALTSSTYYLVETQAPSTAIGEVYSRLTSPIAISINYNSHNSSQISIVNRLSFDLPLTGGIGTFVFTFSGLAVMGIAVALFIRYKKKSGKKA